jgi:hypothetical protein
MTQINSVETYNQIKSEVDELAFYDDSQGAWRAYQKLVGWLKEERLSLTNPELSKEYNKLLIKLQWTAINFFSTNDVLGLFENHLQTAFDLPVCDLSQKTRQVLLGIVEFEERDQYKKKLMHILNNNEAVLTKKRFVDGSVPTLEKWIKKYTSKTSVGPVETVQFEQFFIQDADVMNLDTDERKKLKDFFRFYERLKAPSLSVAGFEGSLPVNTPDFKGFIQNGTMEAEARLSREARQILDAVMGVEEKKYDVDSEISELETKEKQYAEGSLEKKMIDEELKKERKIKELQMVADGYKEGSFERKAVLEEIAKMKRL